MEVSRLSPSPAAPNTRDAGADRSAEQRKEALAENRRTQTAEQIDRAEAARARSADQLAELREAVARVLGANTRLSISRSETSLNFIYRAIDIDTGEIVNEWPQDTFIELVRGVREDVRTDVDAGRELGAMLDRVA
ncbi:MAG: flagellar protein FlaG, partial [Pseudomonadota bacterium]